MPVLDHSFLFLHNYNFKFIKKVVSIATTFFSFLKNILKMQNLKSDIIPKPIIEKNDVFYQVVDVDSSADGIIEFPVRLDDNYKYCSGVAFIANNGYNFNSIIGIIDKGKPVFGKIPFAHVQVGEVYDFNEYFLDINIEAHGTRKFVYVENGGFDLKVIFKLTNKKPEFDNKKFDYNEIILENGSNIGRFDFPYDTLIEKIQFIGKADISSIFNGGRIFFKNLEYPFFHSSTKNDVNNRFIKCYIPTDNLQYEILSGDDNNTFFVVFQYKD